MSRSLAPRCIIFLLLALSLSPMVGNAVSDAVSATNYSHTISSQSTWSELKLVGNSFDGSNSTSAFIEANRCDGGSATCTSGESYINVDYTITMSSNTSRADLRWRMVNPETAPTDAFGSISIYNRTSTNWEIVAFDTSISGSIEVEEVSVNSHNLDSSNEIEIRLSVRHNGSTFQADELALYFFGVYDVREDVVDADGDGILDSNDSCPNGETGWTSSPSNDYDGDGCRDSTEDLDDDNDLILDINDDCELGILGWTSSISNDNDSDGCRDFDEDLDDDNDGYNDTAEILCNSNPLNSSSIPNEDLDGDSICDAQDGDIDGDGLINSVETNDSIYINETSTGSDPYNADSDGDGYCDGDSIPSQPVNSCQFTDDAFPNDAGAYLDTDGDGQPDDLVAQSTTGLVEDLDDDNDNWSDVDEGICGGTDAKDSSSYPIDGDGDGICDLQEVISLSYLQGGEVRHTFETYVNHQNFSVVANLSGMSATSWEFEGLLPSDFSFQEGNLSGNIVNDIESFEIIVWANNSQTGLTVNSTVRVIFLGNYDLDLLPDGPSENGLQVDDDDDNDGILDGFDQCPKGEIGLNPENDTDLDGCRDAIEYNLFEITERNDLHFFENRSSPLPNDCQLTGINNSILSCSSQNASDGGRSIGGSSDSDSKNVLAVAVQENPEWFDINSIGINNYVMPRSNPLPALETGKQFYFTVNEDIYPTQTLYGNISYDVEVEFDIDRTELSGIRLTQDGIVSGTPQFLMNGERVYVTVYVAGLRVVENDATLMYFSVNDVQPQALEQVVSRSYEQGIEFTYNLNENLRQGTQITEWIITPSNQNIVVDQSGILFGLFNRTTDNSSFTITAINSGGNATFIVQISIYESTMSDDEREIPYILVAIIVLILLVMSAVITITRRGTKKPEGGVSHELPPIFIKDPVGPVVIGPSHNLNYAPEMSSNDTTNNVNIVNINTAVKLEPRIREISSDREEFDKWCVEKICAKGQLKIGDRSMLRLNDNLKYLVQEDMLENAPSEYIIHLSISMGMSYPKHLDTRDDKDEYLENHIGSLLDDFAYLQGSVNESVGFYHHSEGDNQGHVDSVGEHAWIFRTTISPKDILQKIGFIRSVIWKFCDAFEQESVCLTLNNTRAFANPLPYERSKEISNKLKNKEIQHTSIPHKFIKNKYVRVSTPSPNLDY